MKEYKEKKITYSDGSFTITYTKQHYNCYICNRKTHISRIKVIQNDEFTKTIVAKKLCLICNKQAKPQLKATQWYRHQNRK